MQDEEGTALNDQHVLNLATDAPKTWAVLETAGTRPSPRYGHSVTLLPAQRKVRALIRPDSAPAPPLRHPYATPSPPPLATPLPRPLGCAHTRANTRAQQ